MVLVVSPQLVSRIIQRFPDYWDHPDPHGLVAVVKDALSGIVSSVNAANIVAGPPPSTEEEAFQWNYAHDHGPGAAYEAVKDLAPGVPKGTGGFLARGFAEAARNGVPRLASRVTKEGLVGRPQQAIEEGVPRAIERPGSQPIEGASLAPKNPGQIGGPPTWDPGKPFTVPSQPPVLRPPFKGYGEAPPNPGPSPVVPVWDASRPFVVQTAPAPQPSPAVGNGGSQTQRLKDPDFRQLSRMPSSRPADGATSLDVDPSNALGAANLPSDDMSPDGKWAARRKPPKTPSLSSSISGGAGANGDGDDPSASLDNRGGGVFDTLRRCMRAATRDAQAWNDFCEDLDPDNRQLIRICQTKALEPNPEQRKGFCRSYFTLD